MAKWTAARRKKFQATMAAKKTKNGGALPPKLERALHDHYRKVVIRELLKSER